MARAPAPPKSGFRRALVGICIGDLAAAALAGAWCLGWFWILVYGVICVALILVGLVRPERIVAGWNRVWYFGRRQAKAARGDALDYAVATDAPKDGTMEPFGGLEMGLGIFSGVGLGFLAAFLLVSFW